MSIRLMNLAWQVQLTSTQKLVLIAMADWSNDEVSVGLRLLSLQTRHHYQSVACEW